MKSLGRQITLALPLLLLLVVVAHADTSPCSSSSGNCLTSPLSGTLNSIPAFLSAALSGIAKIGMPIITVYFVISGFLFVAAQGKPDKLVTAKRNFLYAVIGATLILSAWVLANIIGSTVTQVVG
jgi:hypothetical protein